MWQLEENVVLFEVGGFKKKCFKENYTEPASMVPGLLPHTEKSDEEKFWFLLSGREKQSALQQFEGGGLCLGSKVCFWDWALVNDDHLHALETCEKVFLWSTKV